MVVIQGSRRRGQERAVGDGGSPSFSDASLSFCLDAPSSSRKPSPSPSAAPVKLVSLASLQNCFLKVTPAAYRPERLRDGAGSSSSFLRVGGEEATVCQAPISYFVISAFFCPHKNLLLPVEKTEGEGGWRSVELEFEPRATRQQSPWPLHGPSSGPQLGREVGPPFPSLSGLG